MLIHRSFISQKMGMLSIPTQQDLGFLGLYRIVQGCLLHLKLIQMLYEGVAERTAIYDILLFRRTF